MLFYNALDLNNQKILWLPSIYQFERKLGFWTTLPDPHASTAPIDCADGKSFKFWPQLAPEKRHFTNTQDITSPAPTFNNCDLPWFVCYLCISLENCFLLMAFLQSYPKGSTNNAINHSVYNLELYLYDYSLKSCKLFSFMILILNFHILWTFSRVQKGVSVKLLLSK